MEKCTNAILLNILSCLLYASATMAQCSGKFKHEMVHPDSVKVRSAEEFTAKEGKFIEFDKVLSVNDFYVLAFYFSEYWTNITCSVYQKKDLRLVKSQKLFRGNLRMDLKVKSTQEYVVEIKVPSVKGANNPLEGCLAVVFATKDSLPEVSFADAGDE